MFIVYDLIFLIFVIIYLPIYFFRKKFHQGFWLRLGILPKDLELERPIWLHAVSIGEVMAVKSLIEELRNIYATKKFVISTVTATGNKVAQGIAKEYDFVTYLPLDFSSIVRSVIDRINPSIFIIAETEIWPNLINYLYKKNIPIVVVNGRISDVSFRGYSSIKFLLKPVLEKISIFCMQTERDADKLMHLGVPKVNIHITGNMKFDTAVYKEKVKDSIELRSKLDLDPQDKLFAAGSTHPGEEEIILEAYKDLQTQFSNLKILIAPRHPERSKDIAKISSRFGLCGIFISTLTAGSPSRVIKPVFILDVIGQLGNFYSIADIVFVGGSLIKRGGHNILEPAFLGKPILFGPYMFNFQDIADLFLCNKASIMVYDQEELKINIQDLLNNPAKIIELGQRARQLILENQGATKRNVELLRKAVATK